MKKAWVSFYSQNRFPRLLSFSFKYVRSYLSLVIKEAFCIYAYCFFYHVEHRRRDAYENQYRTCAFIVHDSADDMLLLVLRNQ